MSFESEQSASFRLHGGWLEHKSTEKHRWTPVWCVLKRDGTLFFFISQDTSLETHIGTLRLSKESSFHYGHGDIKDGYKFDLHIMKKKKRFRVKKQYDREIWRAYFIGIITGVVPHDGTLSPQDQQTISGKFQLVQSSSPSLPDSSSSSRSPPYSSDRRLTSPELFDHTESDLEGSASSSSLKQMGARERRSSVPSVGSTDTGSSGEGGFDPPGLRSLAGFSIQVSSDKSSDSGVVDSAGGPFMRHKFDSAGNASTPPWFFEDCNRELAEKIVKECRSMGNTLMRVSSSARPTGSYVITKRLESAEKIVHYEVIRVSEGYKINAENIKNTMQTLGEVMDFFIQLSGPSTTRPMTSNDLRLLGVEYDAYNKGPILPQLDSPAVNTEDFDPPDDNYEVPQQQRVQGSSPSPFHLAHPPPPQAIPLPPPPPASGPSSISTKARFDTWAKDRTDNPQWHSPEAVGPAFKTVSPADRRQIKPDSAKPSAMHVNQALKEHHAVAKLDAVLKGEEQTSANHKGGQQQDKRPPLPAVPPDRPKLCNPAPSRYVNATSGPPDTDQGAGTVHQRWNQRSQSVPCITQDILGAHVPAKVTPPSLIKPGGGGVDEGRGGKTPLLTSPKRFSLDQTDRAKAMPGVMSELELKLRQRAQRETQQPQPSTSLPHKVSSSPSVFPSEDGELYEDLNSYYQNVPTD